MFQPVQEVHIHRMHIPIHHDDDGQAHAHFRRSHYHDEEYEQLSIGTRCQVHLIIQVMHLREGNEQQVYRIQHELDAHEDDDGVATRKHSNDADAEQRNGQEYVIIYRHIIYFNRLPVDITSATASPDILFFLTDDHGANHGAEEQDAADLEGHDIGREELIS